MVVDHKHAEKTHAETQSEKTKDQKVTPVNKAHDEALRLQAQANEAKAKADEQKKTEEQRKVDELLQKADDARAKAAELSRQEGDSVEDTTAEEARLALPLGVDPQLPAGHYRAVKRSNDPSNPKYAPGIPTDDDSQTVKLSRVTNDSKEPVVCWVHPDMAGDYMRAGWERAL